MPKDTKARPKSVPLRRQVERAAGEMNPLLMIFAIGLLILDLTCYVGLQMSHAQYGQAAAAATTAPSR
ncbi:MAG TPA: hypothetical protein VFW46_12170 [Stellaceae bacterium]|nr:hypothetical protein [Stellaceae bacterium]